MSNTSQKGQILLITLLVLSVATTVALALVSRTTTDVNISTQVEESSRAFSAAEAGIEEALNQQYIVDISTPVAMSDGNTSYTIDHEFQGAVTSYEYPVAVDPGKVATFWFVGRDANGDPEISETSDLDVQTVTVCWGSVDADSMPALIASFYYVDNGSTYQVGRVGLDDGTNAGSLNSGWLSNGASTCGGNTSQRYDWDISAFNDVPGSDISLMIRVRPLFNRAWIALNTSTALPPQGNLYTSCGETLTGVERCVQVYQQYRAPSEIFDYVLYSSSSQLSQM